MFFVDKIKFIFYCYLILHFRRKWHRFGSLAIRRDLCILNFQFPSLLGDVYARRCKYLRDFSQVCFLCIELKILYRRLSILHLFYCLQFGFYLKNILLLQMPSSDESLQKAID